MSQYEVVEVSLGDSSETDARHKIVDVVFTDPEGNERRVPAFASRSRWRVRYSSSLVGTHRYRAEAPADDSFSGANGQIEVAPRDASGPLRAHGPIKVSCDRRRLEHADGTPFLWLADTWWYGFTDRVSLTEFSDLAALRARQGFSVVQIVAGLYPETMPFTPEARSSSGWVWSEDFTAPNSAWFDEADRRVVTLLDQDLIPCIVGSWGHYFRLMDPHQIFRHWRELIARWGAYPVVWCLAGEPPLPAQTSSERPGETLDTAKAALAATTEEAIPIALAGADLAVAEQLKRLNETAYALRDMEPFGRPVTIHSVPGVQPWHYLDDESLVDFWLLQTGHQGANSLEPAVTAIHEALAHEPAKPVINGEPSYEGIAGSSWQDTQRFFFWSHLLSGTAGHSYGAHGVWAFNNATIPGLYSGLAPAWNDAAKLPGAHQLGLGRRLLNSLPWHKFEPHPEWVSPSQHAGDRLLPYAAGTSGGPRVFYFPCHSVLRNELAYTSIRLHGLEDGLWQARLIDPTTGAVQQEFIVEPERDGSHSLSRGYNGASPLPSWADWLLLLQQAT
ncbi:DUF4038 domain-containing protein [Phytoactinopolyspora limicola]|uniref:apiosidase-like domain-containing protein n=1 Tax=Phytoactinopolyspora limicola TaxID=2715536 RepID=UPI00140BE737|nr:DUF4038 domain-containing protein [Phytoactinopolyspora limicola]